MTKAFKHIDFFKKSILINKRMLLPLVAMAALLLSACENDLKEIQRVSSLSETPQDISLGVELIYSDSAMVKAKLISSKMIQHGDTSKFYEFPDDILVIFYNEKQQEDRRVTSKYGIYREKEQLVELRNNVVATMADGTVFKSEELYWDDGRRIFYNTLPLTITSPNGDIVEGTSFESDENFKNRKIMNMTSTYQLKDNEGI
ncbi:LPS export ABC transporter periplasmic protein LptC [Olivibacter sitiensis]|uniref:LPS export ABC transporter periplasmic protein LptC n=1 Tax=Olivibacter sitiensis TaxID=376470 RepID=UPI00146FA503|nr:LPS export ABC transporter periplasmic protein LptC [Olivibacter sitiensis]